MGLPMYRDPDEEPTVEEVAAKLDRAAANRRSTIRREPSVRPRDTLTRSQSLARLIRDPRRPASRSQERTDIRMVRLRAELETLRRLRSNMSDITPDQALPEERFRRAYNNEMDLLMDEDEQDMAVNGHVEPADVVRSHLPRPSRESNLRFEILHSSSSRPSSPWRHRASARSTMPSPPYSSGSEHRDRSIPDGPLPDDNSMPALTEGFAPAHSAADSAPQIPLDQPTEESHLETPPPEGWEASYPPLRRVRHLSPRPLPRVDGLGDRRRSPSSYSDSHEEETWATILTEMNTGLRSDTSTSFGSTALTSQISDFEPRSRSRSDRNYQNVSTSFGEIGSGDETCELDLPPGITEEDVMEMRARHHPRNNHYSDQDQDRMTGRRGLQEHQDRLAARIETDMFRAILERLRRREDIPDDWWATVGLSEFARTLE